VGTPHGRISGIPLPVSRLILGTAPFGDRTLALFPATRRSELFFQLLDAVWEQGCNAFDAAAVYQLGGSERLLGAWTKSRGNRERVVLITKGAHPSIPLFRSRVDPRAIVEDLEGSLRRLRTDYVDLYLLHRDDPSVPVGPLVETLHRLRERGRILAYGGSNWSFGRVAEANAYAVEHGLMPFAASSPHFSLAEWKRPPYPGCISIAGAAGAASRAWYGKAGVAVLAWSSLSKGYFGVSTMASAPRVGPRAYDVAVNRSRFDRVHELARKRGVSPAQVALAYVFAQRMETFAIVSTHSAARFREDAEALQLSLTTEEALWLEQGNPR
jgi:aryl-alcohol dehydrogenase-like predicted oxidoreductase